ncbi:hypothetical protein QEJ31_07210 [Pigmentibacter sp. JX0631]|uniref:hypothetical protein n=1 Tax=Pigmentibacter sp. JX0631 TaxID=2976982 RepID=UPI0024695D35|nr:hypothetical protein [Pigmentibacter sp. JX0631]WGL61379.1 hypothetical protein QEJ31_07210 [Pigmentibacter sp. JX0631]
MKNKIVLIALMTLFSLNVYASSSNKDEGFRSTETQKYSSKGKKNMMCSLKGDC